MKMRIALPSLLALLCLALVALPAMAGTTVYDNGLPTSSPGSSPPIGFFNNSTSNTVEVPYTYIPTDISFYVWTLTPRVPLGSVTWSFTNSEGPGPSINFGTDPVPANTPCIGNAMEQLCHVTIDFTPGLTYPIAPGTETWLNLSGMSGLVDWAVSGNPNAGAQASTCFLVKGVCGPTLTNIPTEAFSVSGTYVTPEPGSILLLGTGILGFAGVLRRKLIR